MIPATAIAGGSLTYNVTKTADTADGACTLQDCSLREALIEANGSPDSDIINVPAGTFKLTRTGRDENLSLTGDLDIRQAVEIRGAGARKTIVSGNGIDRVFHVPDLSLSQPVQVWIQDVTITGGVVAKTIGGGIYLQDPNILFHLLRSTVRGNRALQGGGIQNGYPALAFGMVIERSTISGNRAPGGQGGGIQNYGGMGIINSTISGNRSMFGGGINHFGGTILIRYSTIAFNVAQQPGGGIFGTSGVSVEGSIIAKNTSDFTYARNCSGAVDSWGRNLENGTSCGFTELSDRSGNPRLDPLGNYGGPTNTHRLLATSPAINRGGDSTLSTDQRGISRPRGAADDIGAYER